MTRQTLTFVGAAFLAATTGTAVSGGAAQAPVACARCAWTRPETARVTRVRTAPELYRAVADARPGTTVLLADGEYRLVRMLEIVTPGLVLRGESADASRVILRGASMAERQVGVAISVGAADVTIADLTVGYVGFHGIQVRGELAASRVMIHGVRVVDTGQQLLKGSTAGGPQYADEGVVSCSTLEYSDHAPSDYTNAVDVLGGRAWIVRHNTIRRIHGPLAAGGSAGPAILFWANSLDTVVDSNLIVDSFRGIALGLGPGASRELARDGERVYDHQGGAVRNNVVVNLNAWGDEGIEANAARDVQIDHNTVFIEGGLPWSISVRFDSTNGRVRNNLSNRRILFRDGGQATLAGNVDGAERSWFVNPPAADLGLSSGTGPAIDGGVATGLDHDMRGGPRAVGAAPDAGAFEYGARD